MSVKRLVIHLVSWLGVFSFWLLLTLDHHPTRSLAAIATGIIVACSAAAVYLNSGLLLPRFGRLRWPGYLAALAGMVILLALAAAGSITVAYDTLWGPDPLRYSFRMNVLLDGIGIVVHLLAAMITMRARRGGISKG